MTTRGPRSLVWLLSILALLSISTIALAALVPHPLRSAIVVKSIAYERGFAERQGDAAFAVVVGQTGPSADDGRAMASVLRKLLAEGRVAGRRVNVVLITHESNASTLEALVRQRADVVYLASGLESLAPSIPPRQDKIRRILICADGAAVGVGCTLGVELEGQKPRLVLNLKQANSVGLRFDPGLLRLARIVR